MFQAAIRSEAIDRWAIGLSGLCLVHCVASAVFLAVLASAGGLLLDPIVHEVGMMFALVLGVVGLGIMAGALTLDHGGASTLYSIVGVLIVALGHDLNRRAVI